MSELPPPINPYAAPVTTMPAPTPPSEVEEIRRRHLSHEASVKSIGVLYLLGGGIMTLLGVGYIFGGIAILIDGQQYASPQTGLELAGLGVVFLVLGVLQIYAAFGLRRLKVPGRIIATIFSTIGLLGVPVGTLISGYILYLLWSAKGKYVFTPQYRSIIEQTPHIKYKTSIVVLIFIGLLVVLIVVGVLSNFFS